MFRLCVQGGRVVLVQSAVIQQDEERLRSIEDNLMGMQGRQAILQAKGPRTADPQLGKPNYSSAEGTCKSPGIDHDNFASQKATVCYDCSWQNEFLGANESGKRSSSASRGAR
jgi:hypothetical protein